jgi:hypothetical protein
VKRFIAIIIFFSVLTFISCKPKEKPVFDDNQETQDIRENIDINEQILYVGSFDGLNLREEYGIRGKKIRLLPQYTKLLILEKSQNKEKIDGLEDYWYKVDTGDDVGWVFGAYLISTAGENVNLGKPVLMVNESAVLEFPDSRTVEVGYWGDCYLREIDTIKIYDSTNKEANFSEIVNTSVSLVKLPETEDWLYLVTEDLKNHGFIFVSDISEKSFYGNFEDNEKSFNYYRMRLIKEYEILKKRQNIKRYGPLLEIYYNHNVLKLWDSFTGGSPGGHKYLLLDYYEGYDEILLFKQSYEGGLYQIYSLPLGDFVGETGGIPIFNKARDAFYSLDYRFDSALDVDLKVFLLKNGVFEEIKDEYIFFFPDHTINGSWINDNEFRIDYTSSQDGSLWDGPNERNGTVLARRNSPDADFEFIHTISPPPLER